MVRLTRIYTRSGDKGQTSLGNGARTAKHDLRVSAYGAVDEANASIGVARLSASADVNAVLMRVQNDLFDLGADLCTPQSDAKAEEMALRMTQGQITWLENTIDRFNADLAPLESFILPGGTPAAANLHVSRTVIRRAEALISHLAETQSINPLALAYANRLSDLLFVLARWENGKGAQDVLWVPGKSRNPL